MPCTVCDKFTCFGSSANCTVGSILVLDGVKGRENRMEPTKRVHWNVPLTNELKLDNEKEISFPSVHPDTEDSPTSYASQHLPEFTHGRYVKGLCREVS